MGQQNEGGYLGIYGCIALQKAYCQYCQRLAFIIDGTLRCCGAKHTEEPKRYKRECADPYRKYIPLAQRQEQLSAQDNRCFYCGLTFGGTVKRKLRSIKLRVTWDHYIPFVLTYDESPCNIVAACQICNGIKSDLLFKSSGEAIAYVLQKRNEKGYV